MDISVIVPVYNEDESLPELREWITRVMNENNFSYEVIMVDDGSTDTSWEIIEKMSATDNHIKGVKFRRNYGKSAALNTGFKKAQGDVVITMDADMQDSPDEIPELYRMVKEEKYDVVSGWKKKRYDPISKTVPSKLFNFTARLVTGIKLHDFNCGLKAYRNTVVKSIEVYGEMHRYIPVLAKQAGFRRIGEKVVQHRKRKYGVTKFGLERFVNGYLDLLTVSIVSKFGKSPMHFFGLLGSLSFLIGFGILTYLSIAKFAWNQYQMTDRPLFYFGLLTIIFGAQLFLTGFTAELVTRSAADRNTYLIEDTAGK
ncbi:MAG: glycosyltransferase family 2 protein [Bacteroidales bacterium]|nr:glycosyltransferase family 2 protein [Bacteroidales bacterium]